MSNKWPSISPWSVWDLTVSEWVLFATATDAELEAHKAQNRRRG